jgi:hypothetical protein
MGKELKETLNAVVNQLAPLSTTPTGKEKLYKELITKFPKLWTLFLDTAAAVGQVP